MVESPELVEFLAELLMVRSREHFGKPIEQFVLPSGDVATLKKVTGWLASTTGVVSIRPVKVCDHMAWGLRELTYSESAEYRRQCIGFLAALENRAIEDPEGHAHFRMEKGNLVVESQTVLRLFQKFDLGDIGWYGGRVVGPAHKHVFQIDARVPYLSQDAKLSVRRASLIQRVLLVPLARVLLKLKLRSTRLRG